MNFFKKIHCRIFQGAFRLALPFLPYREPKGLNSLNEIPDLLASTFDFGVFDVLQNSREKVENK